MKVSTKTIQILLITFISILSFFRLLRPGFFSMQDDVQVFRLNQLDQCFRDGQVPCRYIPEGGFGYSYPLFNYYSPLPYLIGEVAHVFGFSYIDSVKIVFIIGYLLSALGMYFMGRIYWGGWGGMVSAVFYLFAPYHAVDGYVRGALGEFMALGLVPWLFWAIARALDSNKIFDWLVFSFAFALLLLTHNLSVIIFLPALLIFGATTIFLKRLKVGKRLAFFTVSLVISLAMAGFFIFPAILEKNLVTIQTMTEGYFDFRAHFVTLNQLFLSRYWGYGASLFGPIDDMSFQIGVFHWLVPAIITGYSLWLLLRRKLSQKIAKCIATFVMFLVTGLFAAFLTHPQSVFIWKSIPFMAYFQFPWRFLSLVIFSFSFCSGAAVLFFASDRWKKICAIVLSSLVIIINISYFREDIWFPSITDNGKLSGSELIRASGAGLRDYWPVFGKTYPKSFAPQSPWFSEGEGSFSQYKKMSNRVGTEILVSSEKATVVFPIVNFPDWQVLVDNEIVDHGIDEELGLVKISLVKGSHTIELKFVETPFRKITNCVSLFSLSFALAALLVAKARKK